MALVAAPAVPRFYVRALRRLSAVLLGFSIVTGLFVVYELYGTGWQTARGIGR